MGTGSHISRQRGYRRKISIYSPEGGIQTRLLLLPSLLSRRIHDILAGIPERLKEASFRQFPSILITPGPHSWSGRLKKRSGCPLCKWLLAGAQLTQALQVRQAGILEGQEVDKAVSHSAEEQGCYQIWEGL